MWVENKLETSLRALCSELTCSFCHVHVQLDGYYDILIWVQAEHSFYQQKNRCKKTFQCNEQCVEGRAKQNEHGSADSELRFSSTYSTANKNAILKIKYYKSCTVQITS
ncbi:Voltage-Dependent T-Type Calcium Channel Subunit Alpha-1H [Manis pentadactyla]|nr:Voltage-Dependent T-Type Calcium Channel Subunit Alpha-1H [Manis pentadactyla]